MDQNVQDTSTQNTEAAAAAPKLLPGKATSQSFAFHFRTDKIRDEAGKVISNGRKHPTVTGVLPVPTYVQMRDWLEQAILNPEGKEGTKEAGLMLDALLAEVDFAARQQINEFRETQGLDKDFAPTSFDLSKLTITAIANTPKSERGGPEISDEDWAAFLQHYQHVMVQVVGYEEKRVTLHATHFKAQLRRVKNDKAAVGKLLDMLNLYASKAPEEELEDHTTVFTFLVNRAGKYLKAEEKDLSQAL